MLYHIVTIMVSMLLWETLGCWLNVHFIKMTLRVIIWSEYFWHIGQCDRIFTPSTQMSPGESRELYASFVHHFQHQISVAFSLHIIIDSQLFLSHVHLAYSSSRLFPALWSHDFNNQSDDSVCMGQRSGSINSQAARLLCLSVHIWHCKVIW